MYIYTYIYIDMDGSNSCPHNPWIGIRKTFTVKTPYFFMGKSPWFPVEKKSHQSIETYKTHPAGVIWAIRSHGGFLSHSGTPIFIIHL